jgi:hypothetical protein
MLYYSYETTFAFLREACDCIADDRILQSKYLSLQVRVGEFSYSEIPRKYLKNGCILGVSGTLQQMLPNQREFMHRQYDLKQFAIMPCCYGIDKSNRFKFLKNEHPLSISPISSPSEPLPDLRVVGGTQHFEAITDEILVRLRDNGERYFLDCVT